MSFNSFNKVLLLGRLGKDPELRYSQSGVAVTRFSLATSERGGKDQSGNFQEKTEWHNIVVFKSQAENCSRFIKKGSLVFIEGRIQTRKYQDKNGIDRYSTEIVADIVRFMDSKEASPYQQGGYQQQQQQPPQPQQGGYQQQQQAPQFPQQGGSQPQSSVPEQTPQQNQQSPGQNYSEPASIGTDLDDDDDLPF